MDIVRKPVYLFALLAFCFGCLGAVGANALIGAAHGAAIVALLGCFVLRFWDDKKETDPECKEVQFPFRPSAVALLAITVFCALSVFFNWESYGRPFKDLKKLRYELIIILLLLIPSFRRILYQNQKLQKLGFWLAWGGVIGVIVAGIIGLTTGFHPLLMGPPKNPNYLDGVSGTLMSFAYTLQFFVLLAAALVFDALLGWGWTNRIISQWWPRLIFFITLIVITGALYLTYRRGPVIGIVIGGIGLLFLARNVKLWIAWAILVVLIPVAGYYSDSRHFKNFSSGIEFNYDSDDVRFSQWKVATLSFLDNPLFGLGHRQLEKQCVDLKKKYGFSVDYEGRYFSGHAHSNFFEAFASNGVFGGLAFIAFCLFWVYELVRSSHAKLYFLPVALAFIVSGFFENTFTDSEVLHTILLLYFFSQVALDRECMESRSGL